MDVVPCLYTVDALIKKAIDFRNEVIKLADSLPDEDCYAYPYSILSDITKCLDDNSLNELRNSIKESNQEHKKNSNQSLNRAKKWCVIK